MTSAVVLPKKKSFLSKIISSKEKQVEKKCFLITSSGHMGTYWLASQLNAHPKIFCSHAYNKPAEGAAGLPPTGEAGKKQRANIDKYLQTLSLHEFFSENAQVTHKPFVGNVHAYNIHTATDLIKKGRLSQVKIANLIRHPIARINSHFNNLKNDWFDFGYFEHLMFVPEMYRNEGRQLVQHCFSHRLAEFDDSLEKQFFIVAALLEKRIAYQAEHAEKNNIPNFKYEELTTSKAAMEKLVSYLCEDTLIKDYSWINDGISYKKINSHTKKSFDTAEATFDSWESWKQELYNSIISEKVFKVYSKQYSNF